MQSSPVWVPWNGYKQCYVPMASIESTWGRKLKDTCFLSCVFWCCHNTCVPKSWVSPPAFRLHPHASVGLQPSILELFGPRGRGMATSLLGLPPMAPEYISRGFSILVKNVHFRFVGPFVGARSPTYRGGRTKCWARWKAENLSYKDNRTRHRPSHTHFLQKWHLWRSFLGNSS